MIEHTVDIFEDNLTLSCISLPSPPQPNVPVTPELPIVSSSIKDLVKSIQMKMSLTGQHEHGLQGESHFYKYKRFIYNYGIYCFRCSA